MFHAARSGKQHLAFESLESRHLLSGDLRVVDFQDAFVKQAPASSIVTVAPAVLLAGQVDIHEDSKVQVFVDYSAERPLHVATHFDGFESEELKADEIGAADLALNLEQTQFVSLATVTFVQSSQINWPSSNAPSLLIELAVFNFAPAHQVALDRAQQDLDSGEGDDIELDGISLVKLREPTGVVETKPASTKIVATPSHNGSTNAGYFAVPIKTAKTQADVNVAAVPNTTNFNMESEGGALSSSTFRAPLATPSQQPSLSSLWEPTSAEIALEYVPELDAPLSEGTEPAVDSPTVDAPPPTTAPTPSATASVQELLTNAVATVIPATGELVSAGLSGDYEAIDLAMNQLLQDLDAVRSDATLFIDESTLRGLASAAAVGVIAAEIARRRMREKERAQQATMEEHLAIWMYPECSGVSGRSSV